MSTKGRKPPVEQDEPSPERRLYLYEYIDKRIAETTQRDRDFIRYSITITLSIVTLLFTIAASILAIVGFRTFDDIKHKTTELAQEMIRGKIEELGPSQKIRNSVEAIYAQTIVNAARSLNHISDATEREFLVDFILRDPTDVQFFKSAVAALSAETNDALTQRRFVEYVYSNSTQHNRISDRSLKIATILDYFSKKQISTAISAARKWIASNESIEEIRIAAINYARAISDRESLRELANATESERPSIAGSAYLAISIIEPKSALLSKWLTTQSTPMEDRRVPQLIAIASDLCQRTDARYKYRGLSSEALDFLTQNHTSPLRIPRLGEIETLGRTTSSEEESQKKNWQELAITIVNILMKEKLIFQHDRELKGGDIVEINIIRPWDFLTSASSATLSACSWLPNAILRRHTQETLEEFRDVLQFFTLYDRRSDEPLIVPYVALDDKAWIKCEDGTTLSKELSEEVLLKAPLDNNGTIYAGYSSKDETLVWKKISAIGNLEGSDFRLTFRVEGHSYTIPSISSSDYSSIGRAEQKPPFKILPPFKAPLSPSP